MNEYKVFKYDSRNTGYYINQGLGLYNAKEIAIALSKTDYPKTRVENNNGYFCEYENGEITSWSLEADVMFKKDMQRLKSIQNSYKELNKLVK